MRHHGSAHQNLEGVGRRATRGGNDFSDGHAHGHVQRHGLRHRPRHGQILVRHGTVPRDVNQRLDVGNHRAHIQRQAAGRDHAAGYVINQNELVARRVDVAQGADFHVVRKQRREGAHDVIVLFLDADNAAPRAHALHGRAQAGEHLRAVVEQKFLVLVQQRFALRRVHNVGFRLPLQLHRGRESRSSRAHYAVLLDGITQRIRSLSAAPGRFAFASHWTEGHCL